MFQELTDSERDQLAAKLTSAAGQFAAEYSALDKAPTAARDLYPMPREGISGWLNCSSESMFLLAELRDPSTALVRIWAR